MKIPAQTGVAVECLMVYLLNIRRRSREKSDPGENVKQTLHIVILISAAMALGCQPAANNTNTAANTSNAANANKTANVSAAPTPAPANATSTGSVGSLATPTEAYKTAYELRAKKDVAGLKKIMSPDIMEFLTMMGEAENKSLDDMIMDMCNKPQADRAESRNEKITGDTATVEYLTETGSWKTMDFEKINGEWKLTFPKAGPGEANKKN